MPDAFLNTDLFTVSMVLCYLLTPMSNHFINQLSISKISKQQAMQYKHPKSTMIIYNVKYKNLMKLQTSQHPADVRSWFQKAVKITQYL